MWIVWPRKKFFKKKSACYEVIMVTRKVSAFGKERLSFWVEQEVQSHQAASSAWGGARSLELFWPQPCPTPCLGEPAGGWERADVIAGSWATHCPAATESWRRRLPHTIPQQAWDEATVAAG